MKKYSFAKIEKKWQTQWLKDKIYEPNFDDPKKPFYNLMMFPYPSAEGLHIGGVRTFTGIDIYGRFKRMQGYDVFEPIGLDGFGINAENYALKINKNPKEHSGVTEKNFYRQLHEIGNGFAWDEKIETYDPEYYKWTQWIFIQLFKAGLAYRKKALVNWCPKCLTVLANEQVLGGHCERCDTLVIQKELEQWFFKTTQYAEKLLQGLDTIDWDERIKIAQRNWIGKSEGALITFPLVDVPGQEDGKHALEIFTTRPDTLFGATFIVISPERAKLWIDIGWQASDTVRQYVNDALGRRSLTNEEKETEKTGVASGVLAINPGNKEKIPVWISDYVLGDVGTGAIMAVPAHDQRDKDFALKFQLEIRDVVVSRAHSFSYKDSKDISIVEFLSQHGKEQAQSMVDYVSASNATSPVAFEGSGVLINSGEFSWEASEEAKWQITEAVGGKRTTHYRLRDWLISRQRYWGPPIPMIWCDSCDKWIPEKEENLPVLLPDVKEFRPTGTGKSPLADVPEFYETTCPECGGKARRETDVSDTFLDSAWYYMRYLDPQNTKALISKERASTWLPVTMYIGGAEHAVLHLLYVRFISMVLHDLGIVDFAKKTGGEPVVRFRAHGLITKDGAKMSKSRGNVVNPDEYLKAYGADAVRMYLAFMAPLEQGGDFRDTGVRGMTRFLARVWEYYQDEKNIQAESEATKKLAHKTIQKVTDSIERLAYNTALSALMVLLTQMEQEPDASAGKNFLHMLAPFAPHITEEIYEHLGKQGSIHVSAWPMHDPAMLVEDTFQLVMQINGKMRATVQVPVGVTQEEVESLMRTHEKIRPYLDGVTPKKIIFVPNRLINIVV